jgi:hypothetical protein
MLLVSVGAAALGALLVIVACALPILESGGASISLFNSGNSGWYTMQPIIVVVLGLAAAAIIVAVERKLVPQLLGLVAAGALIGIGIETLTFFAGYEFGGAGGAHAGTGALVGLLAALLLIAGGAAGLVRKMKATDAAS